MAELLLAERPLAELLGTELLALLLECVVAKSALHQHASGRLGLEALLGILAGLLGQHLLGLLIATLHTGDAPAQAGLEASLEGIAATRAADSLDATHTGHTPLHSREATHHLLAALQALSRKSLEFAVGTTLTEAVDSLHWIRLLGGLRGLSRLCATFIAPSATLVAAT